MADSLQPCGLPYARLSCPSPTPWVYSNSCLLNWWCHPAISSSVIPFSSYLQSFPASGSFPMSQFFTSGGQSIGVSASASVLPMNVQDRFSLGWAGWISLLNFIQFCPLENINKYGLSARIAKFHGDSSGTRAGWSKSPEECLWNSFSRWGWCRCFCMDALRCSKCPALCSNPDPSPAV